MKFYEVYTPFMPVMKWAMKVLNKPMQENCKEPLTPLTDEVKQSLNEVAHDLWRK